MPSTPRPVWLSKPAAGRVAAPSRRDSATIASASGCSLSASTAAASATSRVSSGTAPRSTPGASTIVRTAGCPSVIVPVLSNTTVSIAWLRSSASPPLMSTPSSAPRPVETITAVGTASPMAHGQAMISTVTADTSACRYAGAGPTSNQTTKVTMAIDSTTGTNTAETRSASRWIGALLPCACWTRRMIRDSTVSPPTRSTRTRSAPFRLSVAPMTVSPGRLVIGVGSPVSIDSSTLLAPSTTTPSAGIVSPGRTRTSSPGRSAVSGMSSSCPAAKDPRGGGPEPDQTPDGARRLPLGPGLEQVAQQHQRDDPGHRLVVHVRLDASRGEPVVEQRHGGAEKEGGARPHGDQRVHVRAVMPEGRPCPGVEMPARPADHRKDQEELQVPRRAGGVGRHRERRHAEGHCRHAHHRAHGELPPERTHLGRAGLVLGVEQILG